MNGYDLSRRWFDFAFENRDCKVQHTALYMWIIELNNRLGWKVEFGLPMGATMEGLSIGNKTTYSNTLKDLVSWGFIQIVQEAKNQYQSCIIKLCRYESEPALSTALSTALYRHCDQQSTSIESGTVTIDKPLNNETFKPLNNETDVDADRVGDHNPSPSTSEEEKKYTPSKVPRKVSPPGFEFGLDMPFQTAEFAEAWGDWAKFRIEIRHKLTGSQAKAQLEKLASQPSESIAIAMIRQSIENGWQGLFDLKVQRQQYGQPPPVPEKGKIQQSIENTYEAAQRIRERRLQQQN